jgi:hypothetical protein
MWMVLGVVARRLLDLAEFLQVCCGGLREEVQRPG